MRKPDSASHVREGAARDPAADERFAAGGEHVTPTTGDHLGNPHVNGVTSAAERKRRQRERERAAPLLYERDDWHLFCELATLPQKAGCQPRDLTRTILKEIVDNALDTGATVTLAQAARSVGGVTVVEYAVTDSGGGLDRSEVPRLFSINRPLLSSKMRRRPLRGMLGNGLRVVAGAVAATGGSLIVETRGHRLALGVDAGTGHTVVAQDEPIPSAQGTTVRVALGPKMAFTGCEARRANETIRIALRSAAYSGPHLRTGIPRGTCTGFFSMSSPKRRSPRKWSRTSASRSWMIVRHVL